MQVASFTPASNLTMRYRCLNLLLLLVVALAFGVPVSAEECGGEAEGQCANPDVMAEDPSCPSRELIIRCAGKHLDTNGNGKLDRLELEAAIGSLPWFARGILQILGSVDKMVRRQRMKMTQLHTRDNSVSNESFVSPLIFFLADEEMRRGRRRCHQHGL
jgi:hypothetical protein